MKKLKLIKSKPIDEQIKDEVKEIELPMFDIIENDEENWFTLAIKKQIEEQ